MQNIIDRIQAIINSVKAKGEQRYAIPDVAEDMGLNIGLSLCALHDIIENLPRPGDISLAQFRLAVVTAIVRSFNPENDDKGKIGYLQTVYERFSGEGLLTLAEMHAYGTMMYLLQPVVLDETPRVLIPR